MIKKSLLSSKKLSELRSQVEEAKRASRNRLSVIFEIEDLDALVSSAESQGLQIRLAQAITELTVYDEDITGDDAMCRWCQRIPNHEGGHDKDCLLVEAREFLALQKIPRSLQL